MKILFVSASFETAANGAFHFAQAFWRLNAKPSADVQVTILTEDVATDWLQNNDNPMTSNVLKLTVHVPRGLARLGHLFRNVAYFKAVRRLQKQENFDLIVFNQIFYGLLSRLLLLQNGKIAGFVHDDHGLQPTRAAHPTLMNYLFYRYFQGSLERTAMQKMDFVLTSSEHLRRLIIEKQGILPEKTKAIRQVLDIQNILFQPHAWQADGRRVKILFIKIGYVGGGLEDLIRALGLLSHYDFELIVIGPFWTEAHREIEHWAASFQNILLVLKNLQPQNAVAEAMYATDILCIPARREALGLANVEGLARGTSVVSTREGGIVEVMDDGENGWLAAPNNPPSLAEALRDCIETDPSVRLAKSRRARLFVEKNMDSADLSAILKAVFSI